MSEASCGIEMAKVQVCRAVDVAWVMQNLMCLVITSSLWVVTSFRLIYIRRNNFVTIQSQQHLPIGPTVGRSSVFSLGGTYSSHQQPRPRINGGSSYLPANAEDIHFHDSEAKNSEMLATGSRPVNLSNEHSVRWRWLKKTRRKALLASLEKIKEELMLLGLTSLLLGHWAHLI